MMGLLDEVYLGNPVRSWALALALFLVTLTVLPLLRRYLLSQRARFDGDGRFDGFDLLMLLLGRTRPAFLLLVALYVAERQLALPASVEKAFSVLVVLVAWAQVALWGMVAVRFGLERRQQKAIEAGDATARGSLGIVLFVSRLVIFSVAALLALDNLGVNITALVAGLGIGGIAVALAVQTILGDLLASLSIALDKPFSPGDSLRIDDIEGVVETIGVKSTRLRSVSGEQVILSNADILRSRVRNLGRMPERRALFSLGVAYETPPDRLARVPALVEAAVGSVPGTRFEYCFLRGFGESALGFDVCYFVPEPGAEPFKFPRIQDEVNRRIHASFAAEGIEFAYPTRTLIVRNPPGGPAPAASS
jgi:small-conductance mechanosensitive channel